MEQDWKWSAAGRGGAEKHGRGAENLCESSRTARGTAWPSHDRKGVTRVQRDSRQPASAQNPKEPARQDVCGGEPEVTCEADRNAVSSAAPAPEVGSELHHKLTDAMTRRSLFDGTRLSSWISTAEYYVDSAEVAAEVARLEVAASFLHFDHLDRFIALG